MSHDTTTSARAFSASELARELGGFQLGPLSFSICRGEWLSLMGPSGSGKTSLLRCLNLLDVPNSGSITMSPGLSFSFGTRMRLATPDVLSLRKSVGMIFQFAALWPFRTVLENLVDAPVRVLRTHRHVAEGNALSLLDQLGVQHLARRRPGQISGGECQRVAIARALMMEPEVLLCDEITSGLDPIAEAMILDLLQEERQRRQLCVVFATHRYAAALRHADYVAVLEAGKIVEHSTAAAFCGAPTSMVGREFKRLSSI